MITHSKPDGLSTETRAYLIALAIVACGIRWVGTEYLLNESTKQIGQVTERAEYWQLEAQRWRAWSSAYQCPAVTSKCRVDGCVNVCTGEPSIEARP